MKSLRRSIPGVLVVVLAFFAAINLQASDKKSITLYEKSQLNDVQLTPGNYKVEAVTNGDVSELYFYKGKNVVAKVPVELEKLNTTADRSSLRYQAEQGQLRRIIELRLAGENQVFKILDKDKQAYTKKSSSGS